MRLSMRPLTLTFFMAITPSVLVTQSFAANPPAAGSAAQATSAKSEKPAKKDSFCSWGFEVFKEKLSDSCRKSLLSKLKSEQDRIYAERIFKEWEPLTDYQIDVGNGMIQLINDKEEDYLQIQWISMDPAVAFINGVLVVDDQKDDSFYRRMNRMFLKAANTEIAANSRFRLNPLELFLFSDEALAKKRRRHRAENENSPTEDSAFLFTIGGLTAKAADFVERNREGSFSETDNMPWGWNTYGGALSNEGYIPNESLGANAVKCVDGKNGRKQTEPLKQTLDGLAIKIEPVAGSRTQFRVTGYPRPESVMQVNMDGGNDLHDASERRFLGKRRYRVWSKKKHKMVTRTKSMWRVVRRLPCEGSFSESVNPSCLPAWEEMADADNDAEGNFEGIGPYVKQRLEELKEEHKESGTPIQFGTELKCDSPDLFPEVTREKQVAACRKWLRTRFRSSKTKFAANHTARFLECEASSGKRSSDGYQCNKKVEDWEAALHGAKPNKDDLVNGQWQKMLDYLEMYKSQYPDEDPAKVCPSIAKGSWHNWSSVQLKRLREATHTSWLLGKTTANDLGTCQPPPANAPKRLVDSFKGIMKGADKNYKEVMGNQFRDKLERRVVGAMMLNELCNDPKVPDWMSWKTNIKLEGAKGETAQ